MKALNNSTNVAKLKLLCEIANYEISKEKSEKLKGTWSNRKSLEVSMRRKQSRVQVTFGLSEKLFDYIRIGYLINV